jgi:aerobic carbon-monoxide dehydrogenase medium subunit
MKAAAFAYARAKSVEDALQLLAAHGDRAKVLSGGQSLMPAMNLRLISPELIVDIGGIRELRGIAVQGDVLRIGALTRHVDLQRSAEVAAYAPLLAEAIPHVAHPAIRNRGTLGGSLAHADPAAELPACMLALDATIVVLGASGERRIAAANFFQGIFQTALSAEDLLVAVELPVANRRGIHFFHEFARRHGDYAIAGLAASADVEAGIFAKLRPAFFAVDDRPRLAKAVDRLINVAVTSKLLSEVSRAVGDELDPQDDQQASGAMRRHLARVLFARCVATMLDRSELAGETA